MPERHRKPPEPGAPGRPRSAVSAGAVLALWALLIGVVLLLGSQVQRLRPTALPTSTLAQLPCVSYAPFRRDGHTPFDARLKVTPEQIEADLHLLASVTTCVRTYGLDHGLDAVPAVARRLGLRVKLGAWIGRDTQANDAQLTRALALAREHADVVDTLVVGNEVLLRRELTPDALAALLARARRESPVPVTYADVWEFWLRHGAALRPHVDLVAVHVLPYWEDEPVAVAHAVDHVHAITQRVRLAFAPLPVWVAETGWPAAGRQRGPAVPGRAQQAQFVRELLAREARAPVGFNLIEGFDQPWKRALEGAMGGAWGLFDAAGHPRVPLTAALPPDAAARRVLGAAAVCALVGALMVGLRARARGQQGPGRTGVTALAALVATLFGAGCGALVMLQWHAMLLWNRNAAEWAYSVVTLVLAALVVLMLVPTALANWLQDRTTLPQPRVACVIGFVASLRQRGPDRAQSFVLLAWLFVTAWLALQLVFDGRYRALVQPAAAAPTVLLLGLALRGHRLHADAREERVLAAVCALAAVALLVQEGWRNAQAWAAALTWLATASVAWPHRGVPPLNDERCSANSASNTPAAPGPAA